MEGCSNCQFWGTQFAWKDSFRIASISAVILTRFYNVRAFTATLHCSVKFHLKRFNPEYIIIAAPRKFNTKETQKLKGLPKYELQLTEINPDCMNTGNARKFLDSRYQCSLSESERGPTNETIWAYRCYLIYSNSRSSLYISLSSAMKVITTSTEAQIILQHHL